MNEITNQMETYTYNQLMSKPVHEMEPHSYNELILKPIVGTSNYRTAFIQLDRQTI